MPGGRAGLGDRDDRRDARVPGRGLHDARRRSRRPAGSATRRPRAERLERLKWALDRTLALGLTDLMLHAGFLPERDDPGRPAMLDTLAQAGQLAADAGRHAGLRDRPGDRRPAPADARRAEVAQPQGQLRPGQHAALRHGRPDPRRRDPRPGHPLRPRQGCPAADVAGQWGEEVPLGRRARSNIPEFVQALEARRLRRPAGRRARGRRSGRPAARRRPRA